MNLNVGNLPENRLALTNLIYVSPPNAASLQAALRSPETEQQNGVVLVTLGAHVYSCKGHPSVAADVVAMNSLQRKFSRLAMNTRVSLQPFVPPPSYALATLELGVDLLSKRVAPNSRPKELDTDALAAEVLLQYEGQVFQPQQLLAIDFQSIKLQITVKQAELVQLDDKPNNQASNAGSSGGGQLLSPTEITFSKENKTQLITLEGNALADGGAGHTNIFLKDFDFEKLGIGGLNEEFNQIFRRAFASRIWPQKIIKQLGINHVRGMLLFGPPGCGKTLIARQIGKVLNAREPKIVNGPEILNKFVGGSEEKIRELFADAEKEQGEMGDQSMLHIIILDEMDAICKTRGSSKDGTGVSDSVVNQLLSKIDGVDSLNNILLIGMTNRKDMIDDALLRPGRLEVHVEIGLPDEKGRIQVLNIHTKNMKEHNRIQPDVIQRIPELAKLTKNFSGAEIEGLVKAATSFALTRCVDVKDLSKAPDEENLILNFKDFERALNDVEPKFGAKSAELMAMFRNGFVDYGESFAMLMATMERLVEQVRTSDRTPLMTVLLRGPPNSGKTAVAAKVAVASKFPFIRTISADDMIGFSEMNKCVTIHKVFADSYKSPLSIIVMDDIERIIDYVPIGPRFSNLVLQTLLVLLKKTPPDEGRKLLVIGTTSVPHFLEDLGLSQAFSVSQTVGLLDEPSQIKCVLKMSAHMGDGDAEAIANAITKPIGIKHLLMVAEMAKQGTNSGNNGNSNAVDVNTFLECLHIVGY